MAVLSTTLCYPHHGAPTQGIFVQRRLQAIANIVPLHVIAPMPWFPGVVRVPAGQNGHAESPPVVRPRMFYVPRILKSLDADWYARTLRRGIEEMRRSQPVGLIDAQGGWGTFKSFRDSFDFFGEKNPFASDQLAAFPMEDWYLNVLADTSPDVKFTVAPVTDQQDEPIDWATGSAWAIPSGAKHKGQACKWIKTMTDSQTWIAASPIPGASYMVSNMSSASLRISGVTFSIGLETRRSCLSGRMMISRRAMAAI